MGLFNWLMKGMGFENEDAEQDSASESLRKKELKTKQKQEKLLRKQKLKEEKLEKKQKLKEEENIQMDNTLNRNTFASNPDQFNTAGRFDMDSSPSYMSQQNMGGYGTKNVVFFYPKNYQEVQKLVDYLKQGESAILNLDGVNDDEAQRMLDFVSGSVYALNGSTQRVSGNIFLLTPEGLNIMVPNESQNKEFK